MKTIQKLTAVAIALLLPLAACDVDQTEEGELPEIDVEGETQLPEYDVQGPDVDVTTDTTMITTPDVNIEPGGDEGGETY